MMPLPTSSQVTAPEYDSQDFFEVSSHLPCIELVQACEQGNLSLLKELVSKGVDLHIDNDEALMIACGAGHLELVKFITQHNGFDLSEHSNLCRALERACHQGHVNCVEYLADVIGNAQFPEKKIAPFIHATFLTSCQYGHEDIFSLYQATPILSQHLSAKSIQDSFCVATYCGHLTLSKKIHDAISHLELASSEYEELLAEALHGACHHKNNEMISYLILELKMALTPKASLLMEQYPWLQAIFASRDLHESLQDKVPQDNYRKIKMKL